MYTNKPYRIVTNQPRPPLSFLFSHFQRMLHYGQKNKNTSNPHGSCHCIRATRLAAIKRITALRNEYIAPKAHSGQLRQSNGALKTSVISRAVLKLAYTMDSRNSLHDGIRHGGRHVWPTAKTANHAGLCLTHV